MFAYDDSLVDTIRKMRDAGRTQAREAAKRRETKPGNWDKDICDHNCALCFAMRRDSAPSVRSSWPLSNKDEYRVTTRHSIDDTRTPSQLTYMDGGGPR